MNSNVYKAADAVDDFAADLQAIRIAAHQSIDKSFTEMVGRIVPLQEKLQEKKRRLSRERVAKAA